MLFSSLLGYLRSCVVAESERHFPPRSPASRKLVTRLGVEALEDRCLLSLLGNPMIPALGIPQWQQREQILSSQRKGHPSIVFLGDSILEHFQDGAGTPIWKTSIAPLGGVDYAISAAQTQNVLWQIAHGQLDRISPRVAVLMIGSNNLVVKNTPEETAAGVGACVAAIRSRLPQTQVLVLSILPRGASPTDPLRRSVPLTNSLLSRLDDGRTVHFLDVGRSFLQADGTLVPGLLLDTIHPTAVGYQIITAAIRPTLLEILGG